MKLLVVHHWKAALGTSIWGKLVLQGPTVSYSCGADGSNDIPNPEQPKLEYVLPSALPQISSI